MFYFSIFHQPSGTASDLQYCAWVTVDPCLWHTFPCDAPDKTTPNLCYATTHTTQKEFFVANGTQWNCHLSQPHRSVYNIFLICSKWPSSKGSTGHAPAGMQHHANTSPSSVAQPTNISDGGRHEILQVRCIIEALFSVQLRHINTNLG